LWCNKNISLSIYILSGSIVFRLFLTWCSFGLSCLCHLLKLFPYFLLVCFLLVRLFLTWSSLLFFCYVFFFFIACFSDKANLLHWIECRFNIDILNGHNLNQKIYKIKEKLIQVQWKILRNLFNNKQSNIFWNQMMLFFYLLHKSCYFKAFTIYIISFFNLNLILINI